LSLFINIRQLKILLGKSKSSINGAFAKLGYENMPVTFAQDGPLLHILPYLSDRIDIAHQWTVRRAPTIHCVGIIDNKNRNWRLLRPWEHAIGSFHNILYLMSSAETGAAFSSWYQGECVRAAHIAYLCQVPIAEHGI
jgi:hypothetical protein